VIKDLKMMVFDMSGTTVKDYNEVLDCFHDALLKMGIRQDKRRINTMMGWSKIEVFEAFWQEEMKDVTAISGESIQIMVRRNAQDNFRIFKKLLEDWYAENPIEPTEGCLETFDFLRQQNVKIVLNTGFYREVADIIFAKLGWEQGKTFDFSITSDEVPKGRPAPFMIENAMNYFNISHPNQVAKIGDTPSDLQEGKAAGVWSFGVTNGSHTREALQSHDNDGLFESMSAFLAFLKGA
jgi:phosphonatase-like hydrolase